MSVTAIVVMMTSGILYLPFRALRRLFLTAAKRPLNSPQVLRVGQVKDSLSISSSTFELLCIPVVDNGNGLSNRRTPSFQASCTSRSHDVIAKMLCEVEFN